MSLSTRCELLFDPCGQPHIADTSRTIWCWPLNFNQSRAVHRFFIEILLRNRNIFPFPNFLHASLPNYSSHVLRYFIISAILRVLILLIVKLFSIANICFTVRRVVFSVIISSIECMMSRQCLCMPARPPARICIVDCACSVAEHDLELTLIVCGTETAPKWRTTSAATDSDGDRPRPHGFIPISAVQ